MAKVIMILNHNAIIAHDQELDRVLLLLAKGIGFQRKVSESVVLKKEYQTYELKKELLHGDSKQTLRQLDPVYLEIASELLEEAKKVFPNVDSGILLMLSEHISFAVSRIQSHTEIYNPFSDDIRLLFPEEYAVASLAKQLILERIGIEINNDEISYITIHIHSAIGDRIDDTMVAIVIMNESVKKISTDYSVEIDTSSLSYSRLLNHMKFMVARLKNNEVLLLDMEDYTKSNFPNSYTLAKGILDDMSRAFHKEIPKVEIGYLALHIERIFFSK